MATKTTTPQLDALTAQEPDLVDRIFEYLLAECPEFLRHVTHNRIEEAKKSVRNEFAGQDVYIASRPASDEVAFQVLSLFNGRNASEVGRRLQISRATVYRKLKQARRLQAGAEKKPSQFSGK